MPACGSEIDKTGKVNIRYRTACPTSGPPPAQGERVIMPVMDLDVKVRPVDGELLRHSRSTRHATASRRSEVTGQRCADTSVPDAPTHGGR